MSSGGCALLGVRQRPATDRPAPGEPAACAHVRARARQRMRCRRSGAWPRARRAQAGPRACTPALTRPPRRAGQHRALRAADHGGGQRRRGRAGLRRRRARLLRAGAAPGARGRGAAGGCACGRQAPSNPLPGSGLLFPALKVHRPPQLPRREVVVPHSRLRQALPAQPCCESSAASTPELAPAAAPGGAPRAPALAAGRRCAGGRQAARRPRTMWPMARSARRRERAGAGQ